MLNEGNDRIDIIPRLDLGSTVMWYSQAQGRTLAKVGRVLAVVMPGVQPCLVVGRRKHLASVLNLPADRKFNLTKLGGGNGRPNVSYLIGVGDVLYWPKVEVLKIVSNTGSGEVDAELRESVLRLLRSVRVMDVDLAAVELTWVEKAEFDQHVIDNHFVVGPFRYANSDVPGEPSAPYRPHDPLYGKLKGGLWIYSCT